MLLSMMAALFAGSAFITRGEGPIMQRWKMSSTGETLSIMNSMISLDFRESNAWIVARITACVVMVLAMLWSTQGGRFESIFTGLNAMIACLAPPITAVFLFGVFWPRGTHQASLATLILGFLFGAVTFTLDFPLIGDTRVVTDGLGIPFMLQAWWLFVICSAIFISVTLVTPAPAPEKVRDLCWTNPLAALQSESVLRLSDPRLLSGALIVAMVILYWTYA